jgi:hypothetical protein
MEYPRQCSLKSNELHSITWKGLNGLKYFAYVDEEEVDHT